MLEMNLKATYNFPGQQLILPKIWRGKDKLCVLFWNEFR